MARTVKDPRLDNRTLREKLAPAKKPYWKVIETGRHIGYYKGKRTGTWQARATEDGKYVERTLGTADDTLDANGVDVLSFSQAQAMARDWFDQRARGAVGEAEPYLIEKACDDYLDDYRHRQGKDERGTRQRLDLIKAKFGKIEVAKITTKQIKDWQREMGDEGPLTRSKKLDADGRRVRRKIDPSDKNARRQRLATANRKFALFKAVLNLAYRHQDELKITLNRKVWDVVKPFKGASEPKIRYLTDPEAKRLINASSGDFRDLVAAALVTGARYGELGRFRVCDFDQAAQSIYVYESKSGKPRSIALTDEGVALFAKLAMGKEREDRLLIREDGTLWGECLQIRPMKKACEGASIKPAISFHILRHTYGSRLAMKGVPMGVIAQQLGHSDTRITERHYAHLAPSYVGDMVRQHLGTFGVSPPASNVVPLAAGGAA